MSPTQIRVGGVATVTGDPTGNTDGTAFDGTNAYFDYINSTQGGVCGRKLVLASKRDDMLSNNRTQVQGLISQDNVFAVLPVATTLFSGADLLASNKIPTFGWDINAEWGSEANNPGPANLFGAVGSFINFKHHIHSHNRDHQPHDGLKQLKSTKLKNHVTHRYA